MDMKKTSVTQGAWEPVNVDAAARTSAQEIEVEHCADDDSEDDDDDADDGDDDGGDGDGDCDDDGDGDGDGNDDMMIII